MCSFPLIVCPSHKNVLKVTDVNKWTSPRQRGGMGEQWKWTTERQTANLAASSGAQNSRRPLSTSVLYTQALSLSCAGSLCVELWRTHGLCHQMGTRLVRWKHAQTPGIPEIWDQEWGCSHPASNACSGVCNHSTERRWPRALSHGA